MAQLTADQPGIADRRSRGDLAGQAGTPGNDHRLGTGAASGRRSSGRGSSSHPAERCSRGGIRPGRSPTGRIASGRRRADGRPAPNRPRRSPCRRRFPNQPCLLTTRPRLPLARCRLPIRRPANQVPRTSLQPTCLQRIRRPRTPRLLPRQPCPPLPLEATDGLLHEATVPERVLAANGEGRPTGARSPGRRSRHTRHWLCSASLLRQSTTLWLCWCLCPQRCSSPAPRGHRNRRRTRTCV